MTWPVISARPSARGRALMRRRGQGRGLRRGAGAGAGTGAGADAGARAGAGAVAGERVIHRGGQAGEHTLHTLPGQHLLLGARRVHPPPLLTLQLQDECVDVIKVRREPLRVRRRQVAVAPRGYDLAYIARHVIQCIMDPHVLRYTASSCFHLNLTACSLFIVYRCPLIHSPPPSPWFGRSSRFQLNLIACSNCSYRCTLTHSAASVSLSWTFSPFTPQVHHVASNACQVLPVEHRQKRSKVLSIFHSGSRHRLRPGRHCTPRHPTHVELSGLKLNGILHNGEEYLPGEYLPGGYRPGRGGWLVLTM